MSPQEWVLDLSKVMAFMRGDADGGPAVSAVTGDEGGPCASHQQLATGVTDT